MSKYHELRAAIAKQNWTTPESITEKLRNGLKLEGYGINFQAWSGGVPADEETVRLAIIDEITAKPVLEEYQQILRNMIAEGSISGAEFYVEFDPRLGSGVTFKHGDFERPAVLGGFEVVTGEKEVEQRRKNRTQGDIKREESEKELKEKLDATLDTDEDFYLLHANQCGYLIRNTTVRFNASAKGQYGTSTMTHIAGIAMTDLREFIDSAGNETLASISTHMDSNLEETTGDGDGPGSGVMAMHSDFAKAIFDFLNLEYLVDIDDIKREHRESSDDSGFRSIEHWGGDAETVLGRLIERRGNMNAARITEQFMDGYESKASTWSRAAASPEPL